MSRGTSLEDLEELQCSAKRCHAAGSALTLEQLDQLLARAEACSRDAGIGTCWKMLQGEVAEMIQGALVKADEDHCAEMFRVMFSGLVRI